MAFLIQERIHQNGDELNNSTVPEFTPLVNP